MMLWMACALAEDWVLAGPTLLDVSGRRQVDTLVVRDGRIVHAGSRRPADDDLPRTDGTGTTVIPGLIDGHVHLTMAPGGAFVDRTENEVDERRAHHLRAYLASGVVAVLDTGLPVGEAQGLLDVVRSGPAPVVRLLGPLVSPPGGYVSAVLPVFEPVTSLDVLQRQLEGFDRYDPIGVKVTMEDGMVGPIWPFHTDEVLAALSAQSRPLFVHAMEDEEYARALNGLNVRAFVHPPQSPDEALAGRLAGIPVVTTLSVFDSMLIGAEPERLDDPLFQLTVPADELEAAVSRAKKKASARAVADAVLPRMFPPAKGVARGLMRMAGPVRGRTKKMQRAVRFLHEHGVDLVLGTDSGNWPVFLNEFHGPTTIREVELLVEAGLTFDEVLPIATVNGARLLGLEADLGSLEVGKAASFLVLDADPATDLSTLRRPKTVVVNGEARSPAGWMAP